MFAKLRGVLFKTFNRKQKPPSGWSFSPDGGRLFKYQFFLKDIGSWVNLPG
jgi:hypothetical protein